jgi:hypothetical protein
MVNIVIFIIISLAIIILVECVSYILSNKIKAVNKKIRIDTVSAIKKDTLSKNILDKYSTNSDIQIDHLPGKFFIDGYNNIFIKINDKIIIPENRTVYLLEDPFVLEILNLKRNNIEYFYKKI